MKTLAKLLLLCSLLCNATCLYSHPTTIQKSDRTSHNTDFEKTKAKAEKGDAQEQDYLGAYYNYGLSGVPRNEKKAAYWYRRSAKQNNRWAQASLAELYIYGLGVPQDYQKAVYWYKKSAQQDYIKAENALANLYDTGKGVLQDEKAADYWLEKAARKGDIKAQLNLGNSYYIGRGVHKNYQAAAYWYQKAAARDDNKFKIYPAAHSLAQYFLADLYRTGQGVPQDYQKAFYWYQKSAMHGYGQMQAAAQAQLAASYLFGLGTLENDQQAYAWLSNAIAAGLPHEEDAIKLRNDVEAKLLKEDGSGEMLREAKELAQQYYLKYTKKSDSSLAS